MEKNKKKQKETKKKEQQKQQQEEPEQAERKQKKNNNNINSKKDELEEADWEREEKGKPLQLNYKKAKSPKQSHLKINAVSFSDTIKTWYPCN